MVKPKRRFQLTFRKAKSMLAVQEAFFVCSGWPQAFTQYPNYALTEVAKTLTAPLTLQDC
jgi:hypothetical protein